MAGGEGQRHGGVSPTQVSQGRCLLPPVLPALGSREWPPCRVQLFSRSHSPHTSPGGKYWNEGSRLWGRRLGKTWGAFGTMKCTRFLFASGKLTFPEVSSSSVFLYMDVAAFPVRMCVSHLCGPESARSGHRHSLSPTTPKPISEETVLSPSARYRAPSSSD